jgi:NitT/TauT family transport system permease protein
MRPATKLQLVVVAATILAVETLCRTGIISNFTMIPPSAMVLALIHLLATGSVIRDMTATLTAVSIAVAGAIFFGFIGAVILHKVPRVRRALAPIFATYYAIPIWAFYPLFIVLFGLNNVPKVMIGFFYAIVAMIINTLHGFDRVPQVLRKMARAHGMGDLSTTLWIVLPSALPYIFTGIKLTIAYSFIGVISSEFILATEGIGYSLSFAYLNFDNDSLYGLILFLISFASALNLALLYWERRLLQRRGLR